MSATGTPKASQAAITAVQEALGCRREVWPRDTSPAWCDTHWEEGDDAGSLWTERGCPVAAAAADAAMAPLEIREDVGYGVIIEGTGILMATYDGTAKKYARQVWMTPWVEVPE